MPWNYRVIHRQFVTCEHYAIYEVYYGDHGEIKSWTENPVEPCGETLEELREDLAHYQFALIEPVLEWEDLERVTAS
jgi:hypothetical protein